MVSRIRLMEDESRVESRWVWWDIYERRRTGWRRDPKCLTGVVIRNAMILDVYGRCRDVV